MRKIALVTLLFLGWGIGLGSGSWAGMFLGDFCWELHATEDETGLVPPRPPALLVLGVTFMGGSHLQVSGRAVDPSSAVFATSGSIEMLGMEAVGVLTSAGNTGEFERKVTMAFVALELVGLRGIFWNMEFGFDALNRRFDATSYTRGDMVPVPCPGSEDTSSPGD